MYKRERVVPESLSSLISDNMTVISSGVAFSAVKSTHVDHHLYGPGMDSEDSEFVEKKHGTPMQLQVSMVTTVVRPMTSSEFQAAMDFINNAKDSVKGLIKSGKDFYEKNKDTFEKIKKTITVIQGVGDIVSGIGKFIPEEEDPMVKNLADLTKDVQALGEKLTNNFSEMKNFISQQTFFTDIMSPTAVLTMHMMDCLANPGEDSKENFLDAYQNVTPLRLQYKLNAYLEQKTTNPLRQCMEAQAVKMKGSFEKWEDIYSRVMAQFLLLEAFANGLTGAKSQRNVDRLIEASTETLNNVEKWREEYGSDNGYWEEMRKKVGPYLKANTKKNNKQKAKEITQMMENYFTNDAFYIMVFDEAKWQENYTYVCNNEGEKLMGVWNQDGCNCIIYRSRTAYKVTEEEYEAFRRRVYDCRNKLHWTAPLTNIIKDQVTGPQLLPDNGFIILLKNRIRPEFATLFNTELPFGWTQGPGYHNWAILGNDQEYFLLASFP